MIQWRVIDTYTGTDEEFETETEALERAEEILTGHRKEAVCDGEWPLEVEFLGVYRLAHSVRVTDIWITDDREWVEFGMWPVAKETGHTDSAIGYRAEIRKLRSRVAELESLFEQVRRLRDGEWSCEDSRATAIYYSQGLDRILDGVQKEA